MARSFAPTTAVLPAAGVGQLRALGIAHVLALAAHVRLVNLDRALVGRPAAAFRHPRFADAMEHEPRGLLTDFQVPVELRNGLRKAQVDGDGPLAQRNVRARQRGSRLDAEVAAAIFEHQ